MRKLWVITLLGIILLQSSVKTMIVAHYYVYRDTIASTLCENRTQPLLNCKGKCYLKKKIEAEEKHQNQLPASVREQSEVIFFYVTQQIELNHFSYSAEVQYPLFMIEDSPESPIGSIFHPPPFILV